MESEREQEAAVLRKQLAELNAQNAVLSGQIKSAEEELAMLRQQVGRC